MKTAVFIIFCYPFLLFSQNYAEAHLMLHDITTNLIEEQKNYIEANKQFKKLFTKYDFRFFSPGHRDALLNILCNMNGTWDNDSVDIDFYLQQSIFSSAEKVHILNNCQCTDSITFSIIERKINNYDSLSYFSFDKELINLIDSIYKEDQRVRQPGVQLEELFRVDSINLVILKKLKNQYGRLLGIRDLGGSGMRKYELLIRHLSPEILLNEWYDEIIKGICRGDLNPQSLSNSIDYAIFKNIEIIDGKPSINYSIYGTTIFQDVGHPVKDIKKANRLRREIGLPPLEYYLKKNNIIYDVEAFKQKIGAMGLVLIEE